MKSFMHKGHVWLALIAVPGLLLAGCCGCRKAPQPSSSITTSPSVTSSDYAAEPFEDMTIGGEEPGTVETVTVDEEPAPDMTGWVPFEIDLPSPAFRGTPVPMKIPNVEKPLGKPRPPFLAPADTVVLSRGKSVTSSDPTPNGGELDLVTDGDKEATDFGYLKLRPGREWVQIDMGQPVSIIAIVVWHNHAEARVYNDVVVLLSDDPDFIDAKPLFNNDYDASCGLGIGPDKGYVETSEGKLINGKGRVGRYLRFYSRGNHIDAVNHYTEVEVYGRPAK